MALIQVQNTAEFKVALKQMSAGDTIALRQAPMTGSRFPQQLPM